MIAFILSLLLVVHQPDTKALTQADLLRQNADIKQRLKENEDRLEQLHVKGQELKEEADRNKAKLDAPGPEWYEKIANWFFIGAGGICTWLLPNIRWVLSWLWKNAARINAIFNATNVLSQQLPTLIAALEEGSKGTQDSMQLAFQMARAPIEQICAAIRPIINSQEKSVTK